MAIAQRYVAQQTTQRGGPSGLADVLEVLLDKGLVIDAFVRVSLVGIELLTVDARVVVASVDTYLRFAEAVNRLDLLQANESQTLGDLVGRPSRRSGGGEDNERRPARNGSRQDNGSDRSPARLTAGRSPGSNQGGDGEGNPGRQETGTDQYERAPTGEHQPSEEDTGGSEGGLLSRIKQRGQAF